ncbi:hypothetical protein ISS30_10675 [bacterium]|nr:hypothetical protein [bacterium]
MKKLVIGLCYLALIAGGVFAQANFTARPGALINSADFGVKMGAVNPYIGIDIAWVTVSFNESYDYNFIYPSYSGAAFQTISKETYEMNGNAILFVPHAGLKIYFNDEFITGKTIPYLRGGFFMSIPSVSVDWKETDENWYYENGVLVDYDPWEDSGELEDEELELVEDILSFWGLEIGFGAEYFFSDNFSLGGEFGMRMLFNDVKASGDDEWSSGQQGSSYYEHQTEAWEDEVSATFKLTYAVLTLNYHF